MTSTQARSFAQRVAAHIEASRALGYNLTPEAAGRELGLDQEQARQVADEYRREEEGE